jgi:Xaa-Pro aminopeptidase
MKRDYTLVLKGTMACRGRAFRAARSPMLDAWRARRCGPKGIDFGHGTGHGVGYFLATCTKARRASARPCPTPRWRWSPA